MSAYVNQSFQIKCVPFIHKSSEHTILIPFVVEVKFICLAFNFADSCDVKEKVTKKYKIGFLI